MKIVVLDGYTLNPGDNPWHDLAALGELSVYDRTKETDIVARAAAADILVTNKTPITREHISQLPKLAYIAVLATGYNVVDTLAARERGIAVSNVPAYGTDTVAQHVLALLLAHMNQVADYASSVSMGEWERAPDFCYYKKPTRELSKLKLGIVGYGRIGQSVARLCRALGMDVFYTSRSEKGPDSGAKRILLAQLFAECDVISLHCSQTPENRHFVNRSLLLSMKRDAILINTARGGLVNEADLAWALREGVIGGAALDVLSSEPPDSSNPLLQAPNCIITPHIAWSSLSARQRLMAVAVENVATFMAGSPKNVVNA